MGYPYICGITNTVRLQPCPIYLWLGIGCSVFLRSFEDTPPPSSNHTPKCIYAHSGFAVGIFASSGQPRCRGPPPVSEFLKKFRNGGTRYGVQLRGRKEKV